MEATDVVGGNSSAGEHGNAIHGYSRAEVDEFLAAAAVERERLERDIADARERVSRARSALGMHRVMVAMMLETQRELGELRLHAERRAAEIVAEAEREAEAEAAALRHFDATTTEPPPAPAAPVIDLDTAEHVDSWASWSAPSMEATPGSGSAARQGEDYFDFLRGALADDSPLGPISE
jgi:cell division septum initiation protein DivIVA